MYLFIYYTNCDNCYCAIPTRINFNLQYTYPFESKSEFICPQNDIAGYKRFAYSRKHNKCFEVGYRGPCKPNMKFFLDRSGSQFGKCDCDPEVGYNCGRPLVFLDDWCYPVYSQVHSI